MSLAEFPPSLQARFRFIRPLGAGGFGRVLLVEDRRLGRQSALKLLNLDIENPEVLRRFEREARITATLRHPHIVQVFDHGVAEGRPWIAYEFIEGKTLEAAAGQATPTQIATWGQELAGALATVHSQGILHRDVKPANLLVRTTGEAVLADFGIARSTRQGTLLTPDGLVLGTPAYMAPEVLSGAVPTTAADQFALAATLHQMATGNLPYGTAELSRILSVLTSFTTPPAVLPGALGQALSRALRRNPQQRFPNLEAFADALVSPQTGGQFTVRITTPLPTSGTSTPQTVSLPSPHRGPRVVGALLATCVSISVGWYATRNRPLPASPAPAKAVMSSELRRLTVALRSGHLDATGELLYSSTDHAFEQMEQLTSLETMRLFRSWIAEAITFLKASGPSGDLDPETWGEFEAALNAYAHRLRDLLKLRVRALHSLPGLDRTNSQRNRSLADRVPSQIGSLRELHLETLALLEKAGLRETHAGLILDGHLRYLVAEKESMTADEAYLGRAMAGLRQSPHTPSAFFLSKTLMVVLHALPASPATRVQLDSLLDLLRDSGGAGTTREDRAASLFQATALKLLALSDRITSPTPEDLYRCERTMNFAIEKATSQGLEPPKLRETLQVHSVYITTRTLRRLQEHPEWRPLLARARTLFAIPGESISPESKNPRR